MPDSLRLVISAGAAVLVGLTPVIDASSQGQPVAAQIVFQKVKDSVVTVVTQTGQGSGVLVDPTGVFVTNLHVLQGERSATVRLANGDAYDHLEILGVDARRDLLVAKVRGFKLPSVQLADSDILSVGQPVYAVGTPRGLESSISEGIVSAIRDTGLGYKVIQTSAAISAGSSGGGLFDAEGRLIGITTFKREGGEGLNFAVPVNYVVGILESRERFSLDELAKRYPVSDATGSVQASGAPTSAGDSAVPPLAQGYTTGDGTFALFEQISNTTYRATFTSGTSVYAGAVVSWDSVQKAYIGKGTIKTICGSLDTRIWDAPVTQEIYVISDGLIRGKWSHPTRVNCDRRTVNQVEWREAIWYVPKL